MSTGEPGFLSRLIRLPRKLYRYGVDLLTMPRRHRAQNERIDRLEAVLADSRIEAMAANIPALLNQATSFAHASRLITRKSDELQARLEAASAITESHSSQLAEIRDRVEFVRREILFEFMHQPHEVTDMADTEMKVETRIIDQEKLERMGADIRLNVGCGHLPIEGFLNVDMRELPGVDVIARAADLPFAENSVSELFSAHLIEHFPQEEFTRRILPYWFSLIKPGGVLRAILPDWEAMIDGFSQGTTLFEDLREVTFGAQDYEGDFHYNMFSQDSLRQLLEAAGFNEIAFPVTGRVNGKSLEMEVRAVK